MDHKDASEMIEEVEELMKLRRKQVDTLMKMHEDLCLLERFEEWPGADIKHYQKLQLVFQKLKERV